MGVSNSTTEVIRCSFCGKSQEFVAKIIASPTQSSRVYICDQCVGVCNTILWDNATPGPFLDPQEVTKLFAECENQTRQKLATVYDHYKRIYGRLMALDTVTLERTPGGTSDDVSSSTSSPPSQTV